MEILVEIRLIVLFLLSATTFLTLAAATMTTSCGTRGHRLAGLAGLPSQSVLRRIATQLSGHQIQRQVARIDIVLGAAVLAGIHFGTAAAAAGVEVLLRYSEIVLEGGIHREAGWRRPGRIPQRNQQVVVLQGLQVGRTLHHAVVNRFHLGSLLLDGFPPGGLIALWATPPRMDRVPSHRVRSVDTVQLKVQPAGVADHLAADVPPPDGGRGGSAVGARHILLLGVVLL